MRANCACRHSQSSSSSPMLLVIVAPTQLITSGDNVLKEVRLTCLDSREQPAIKLCGCHLDVARLNCARDLPACSQRDKTPAIKSANESRAAEQRLNAHNEIDYVRSACNITSPARATGLPVAANCSLCCRRQPQQRLRAPVHAR